MLLPIYDRNPLKIIPFQFMTASLIVVCVLIFLWQLNLPPHMAERAVLVYGMIPSVLLGPDNLDPQLAPVSPPVTLLTSAFLHGDWWHLLGNMLFLWVFGDNIEDSMGHWKFLLFYLACAGAAGLIQALAAPGLNVPTVGASGAVAGVLGGCSIELAQQSLSQRDPLFVRGEFNDRLLGQGVVPVPLVFRHGFGDDLWANISGRLAA